MQHLNDSLQTIASLSASFNMSKQAARKHLQVLADSKLIRLIPRGKETIIELDANAVSNAKKLIEKIERDLASLD